MPATQSDAQSADLGLLQGTLDVMILKALSWGPMHGFGVAKWIRTTTDDVLQIDDGALYPALHRMEHRGLIEAEGRPGEGAVFTLRLPAHQPAGQVGLAAPMQDP